MWVAANGLCFRVQGNSGAGGGRAEGSESTDATSSGAKAVALVVDATVTSYLMMGNLPGLKRHAVSAGGSSNDGRPVIAQTI